MRGAEPRVRAQRTLERAVQHLYVMELSCDTATNAETNRGRVLKMVGNNVIMIIMINCDLINQINACIIGNE